MTLAGSPRRLGENDRLGARQIARRNADELAALPLPDAPLLAAYVGLQVDRTDDGRIRTAVRDRIEQLLAVEDDLLYRLLQHLQARIGDRRGPGVAGLVGQRHQAFQVILGAGSLRVPAADPHHAFRLFLHNGTVAGESGAHADVKDLWIVALRDRGIAQHEGVGRIAVGDEAVGT